MRLEQLVYLVEVAKQQSISGAAKSLFISQPALSKAIAALESEFGLKLFKRHQQGITPTAIGKSLIEKAQVVLANIDDIHQLVALENHHLPQGNLVIEAVGLVCNDLLGTVIQNCRREYPHLNIVPLEKGYLEIINDVTLGTADLGIISYPLNDCLKVKDLLAKGELTSTPLSEEPLYVLVSSASPLAQQTTVTMAETLGSSMAYFSLMLTVFPDEPHEADDKIIYCSDRESIKKMIVKNQAMTIMPRFMVIHDFYVESGAIIPIPLVNYPNHVYVSLIYDKNRKWLAYESYFIQSLIELYQTYIDEFDLGLYCKG